MIEGREQLLWLEVDKVEGRAACLPAAAAAAAAAAAGGLSSLPYLDLSHTFPSWIGGGRVCSGAGSRRSSSMKM